MSICSTAAVGTAGDPGVSTAQRASFPSFSVSRTSARKEISASSLSAAGSPDCATTVNPSAGSETANATPLTSRAETRALTAASVAS